MLREFTDSRGEPWRVWDVNPVLHARAGSSKLAAKVPDGWLCFESGRERRRLTPIPAGWELARPEELEALRDSAAMVTHRRGGAPEQRPSSPAS